MSKPYRSLKWTVEIELDEREVADGLDLGKPSSVYLALMRGYPLLNGNRMSVTVKKSPTPEAVNGARGEGE